MKKKDFNEKCKIALFIEIIIVLIGIICYKCYADEFDDLKIQIHNAEIRLQKAEKKLIDINPEMFEFYKQNKNYSTSSEVVNFYLNEHRKEYFEYEKAFGDLEDLLEIYNMALMNMIVAKK